MADTRTTPTTDSLDADDAPDAAVDVAELRAAWDASEVRIDTSFSLPYRRGVPQNVVRR